MSTILLASNFLAGSIISLLIPVTLLICLVGWHLLSLRHVPEGEPGSRQPADAADPLARVSGPGEPPPVDSL